MAEKFAGKVALVTGGGSGIGRAAALLFAARGARVVVVDRNVRGGQETVENITSAGGEAFFIQADVSSSDQVKGMIDMTISQYKRLDCSFNNAGIFPGLYPLPDYTDEMWDQTIDINLKGTWLCMKYEIPCMLETGGGAIVNTSSVAGLIGSPQHHGYVASKWGINGITKSVAIEYAKSGIRVNAICPGVIETPMTTNSAFMQEEFLSLVPMGHAGTPENVAETALWLCSESAAYVTGQLIAVDGGFMIL